MLCFFVKALIELRNNNGTTVLKSKIEISKLRFNMKNTEGHKDLNNFLTSSNRGTVMLVLRR